MGLFQIQTTVHMFSLALYQNAMILRSQLSEGKNMVVLNA